MKIPFKKAFILTCCSAVCFLLVRILQLLFCVETKTGFFKAGYIVIGTELSIVVFSFIFLCFLFSFLEKKVPSAYPKTTLPLAIGYFVVALFVVFDLIFFPNTFSAPKIQKIIYLIFGIVTVATFLISGITYFFKFKILKFSSESLVSYREITVPVILLFWIIRTIIFFTFYTEVAVISDLVFEILSQLSVMVLLLYFSFFINKVENVRTEKLMLPLFVLSFLTSLCASLPKLCIFLFGFKEKLHSFNINNVTTFGICSFLCLLYFYLFGEDNLKEKTKRHVKEKNRFIK